ncbi:rho guanine nucleotide exchange factor 7 isoform X4 [Tribolium castaneum]|uniref:rho guanine nucleotide exchange factor 7 isoform X4 n=1 Tax=Tribolium castaneum TaxID=7070 RepID=UPI000175838C|nr:PREDICTED: rho guanine nucleotide exchange factor 7 isoform X3 [Tribolium castaneum]|eukprot:XP_015835673.1 PREDICTED: rho guanine nucleotide exchange factor 7 isoform X3 [Tribolium castaneum]
MATEPLVVQAIYPFKGSNNDELCFKKGDLITVTQKDDGWWEGTFNGKTGWFPSNYVKESKGYNTRKLINCCEFFILDAPKPVVVQQNQYKSVVLKDLIDSEKAHVTELESLVTNFLQPLEKSAILTNDEYKQLTGNIAEVLDTHQQLLKLMEAEQAKPGLEQRVGRLFLTWARRIKAVNQAYCAHHPKAACILDQYKEELTKYMESRGATSPGVLVLTVLLSKPFRRLDKYSGMLQELERHVEECHPDRGDTQRSVAVYKDIATTCAATRRQKELELQVLTGPVRGWEGPSLTALGDIIFMGSVAVGPQHHDRYFVLFPTTLLILSVSHRLSAFIYEGKLPLSGLVVTRLEDNEQYKNAFEISAPMIEKKIAVCQSKNEANYWVELLRKHMPKNATSNNQKVAPSQAQFVPQPPPHTSPLVAAGSAPSPPRPTTNSPPPPPPHGRGWSATSLRPSPPLRPCLAFGHVPYSRPGPRLSYKEDGLILDVIEAYFSTVKPRNTVNSVDVTNWSKTDSNKNLIDAVQVLQSKLSILEYNVSALSSELREEKQMRCALQNIFKNYLHANNWKDTESFEWPEMESKI